MLDILVALIVFSVLEVADLDDVLVVNPVENLLVLVVDSYCVRTLDLLCFYNDLSVFLLCVHIQNQMAVVLISYINEHVEHAGSNFNHRERVIRRTDEVVVRLVVSRQYSIVLLTLL